MISTSTASASASFLVNWKLDLHASGDWESAPFIFTGAEESVGEVESARWDEEATVDGEWWWKVLAHKVEEGPGIMMDSWTDSDQLGYSKTL